MTDIEELIAMLRAPGGTVVESKAADALSAQSAEIARLKAELEEARRLLAHAVKEADGWHDECRGGPIEDDPMIDAARQQQG